MMAEQDQPPGADESQGPGVFGKLPNARPGTRSPRRSGPSPPPGASPEPEIPAVPEADPAPPAGEEAERPRSSRPSRASSPRPPLPPREPETERERKGVEDLAWAGIAVAAEAATLGVRLLSRAVETVRKPTDRR